jgi:hypothetical protein
MIKRLASQRYLFGASLRSEQCTVNSGQCEFSVALPRVLLLPIELGRREEQASPVVDSEVLACYARDFWDGVAVALLRVRCALLVHAVGVK